MRRRPRLCKRGPGRLPATASVQGTHTEPEPGLPSPATPPPPPHAPRPCECGGCAGEPSFGSAGRACSGPRADSQTPLPGARAPASLPELHRAMGLRVSDPRPRRPCVQDLAGPTHTFCQWSGRAAPRHAAAGARATKRGGLGVNLSLDPLARSQVTKSYDPGCVLASSYGKWGQRGRRQDFAVKLRRGPKHRRARVCPERAEDGSAVFRTSPRRGAVVPHARTPTSSPAELAARLPQLTLSHSEGSDPVGCSQRGAEQAEPRSRHV